MCLNKRVLLGLGVMALAVLAVAPRLLGVVLPLLFLAACPLSMVFMMRGLNRGRGSSCRMGTADRKAEGDGAQASSIAAPVRDAELRELEEEVNRLKAEMRLRDQQSSS